MKPGHAARHHHSPEECRRSRDPHIILPFIILLSSVLQNDGGQNDVRVIEAYVS